MNRTERRFELLVGITCLIAMGFLAGMLIAAWFVMVPLVPHQTAAKVIWVFLGCLNLARFWRYPELVPKLGTPSQPLPLLFHKLLTGHKSLHDAPHVLWSSNHLPLPHPSGFCSRAQAAESQQVSTAQAASLNSRLTLASRAISCAKPMSTRVSSGGSIIQ